MAKKLLIVLLNTDPANAAELDAPFQQAAVAAAMDYDVEVVFSGLAAKLAVKGVAECLYSTVGSDQSVYDAMRQAHDAGAVFKVCSPALRLWGDDLIPEIDETVGGAYLISVAMDDKTVTFTY